MKRVGTFTSAVGLIFLGIMLIIHKSMNSSGKALGAILLKWWPVLIVMLGIEILVASTAARRSEAVIKRLQLNVIVIPVILLFIGVGYWERGLPISESSSGTWRSPGNILDWGRLSNLGRTMNVQSTRERILRSSSILDGNIKCFSYKARCGNVELRVSKDGKIKVESKIYVDRDSSLKAWSMEAARDGDTTSVNLDQDEIKKADTVLYVPDRGTIKLELDSGNITDTGLAAFSNISYEVQQSSGNVELRGGAEAKLHVDSGNMKLRDIGKISIDGSSGTVLSTGNTESFECNLSSGTVEFHNLQCKNIKISLESGRITVHTSDRNVKVSTTLDSGICWINGEQHVNGGFTKTLGSGAHPVSLELSSGTIHFESQE